MAKCTFRTVVDLTVDTGNSKDTQKPMLDNAKYRLEISDNLDPDLYYDAEHLTMDGVKATSNCLIMGLVSNIHYAHKRGIRNDAEHIRWIIAELERGLATNFTVDTNGQ